MYCPLLCIKPNNSNNTSSFCQCMEAACAWWIAGSDGAAGKCALCQMGVYAANHG